MKRLEQNSHRPITDVMTEVYSGSGNFNIESTTRDRLQILEKYWIKELVGSYLGGGNFNIKCFDYDRVQVGKTYYIENLVGTYIDFNTDEFDDCSFRIKGKDAELTTIEYSRRRPL